MESGGEDLLFGMVVSLETEFSQALKAITQPEALRKSLEHIPTTDTHRRGLIKQRITVLSV